MLKKLVLLFKRETVRICIRPRNSKESRKIINENKSGLWNQYDTDQEINSHFPLRTVQYNSSSSQVDMTLFGNKGKDIYCIQDPYTGLKFANES
ncbi:hypothetical protein AYI68_g4620 [Smittium mucronatum]|uniref:Uncharacterized protein n=1 Tax=Smittium mucronatum TaxID=133383 RepID=A0A1R0GWK4_9FUNG|nr:hypothetical protein AYI68_g4620 [Smittium mucronatum]